MSIRRWYMSIRRLRCNKATFPPVYRGIFEPLSNRQMKTNLQITGTVELSKSDLIEAINAHLGRTKSGLQVKKIQYEPTLNSVLCDVYQHEGENGLHMKFEEPEKRNGRGGYKKKYLGFFDIARSILDDQRKAKRKEMSIDDFYGEIQFHFEDIQKPRVVQYLLDRRQLKNISLDTKGGVIKLE